MPGISDLELTTDGLFSAAALALCVFGLMTLFIRKKSTHSYRFLILFFIGNMLAELTVILHVPGLSVPDLVRQTGHFLSFSGALTIAPALWMFIGDLVVDKPRQVSNYTILHFIPSFVALGLLCSIVIMDAGERSDFYTRANGDGVAYLKDPRLFLALVLYIVFLAQTVIYSILSYRYLQTHIERVKHFFATTTHQELLWLNWLVCIFILSWVVVLFDGGLNLLLSVDLPNAPIGAVINLVLIGSLCLWGTRDALSLNEELAEEEKPDPKYIKSALKSTDRERIAARMQTAMQRDRLHTNPNLSLSKLSSHIGVARNYISQTLSITLGTNFFDYVNGFRIEHAKRLLLETDDTIQDISVDAGFNSRSAFYKAFRRHVGCTPTVFRKQTEKNEPS